MICPFPLFKKKKDTTSGTATYYTQGNGTIHGAIGKHTQQEHYAVTKPHTLALPRGALHDTSQIHDAPPSHIFVYLFIYFLVRLAARVTIHVVKCRQVVPLPISPSGKTNKQKTLPCVSYLPSPHTDARTHTGKKKKARCRRIPGPKGNYQQRGWKSYNEQVAAAQPRRSTTNSTP